MQITVLQPRHKFRMDILTAYAACVENPQMV